MGCALLRCSRFYPCGEDTPAPLRRGIFFGRASRGSRHFGASARRQNDGRRSGRAGPPLRGICLIGWLLQLVEQATGSDRLQPYAAAFHSRAVTIPVLVLASWRGNNDLPTAAVPTRSFLRLLISEMRRFLWDRNGLFHGWDGERNWLKVGVEDNNGILFL